MKTKTSAAKKSATKQAAPKKRTTGIKEFFPVKDSMLDKLFHDSLKDIYWAEKHLQKAIPKMGKAASTTQLKAAMAEHLAITIKQTSRLEDVFKLLGHKPQAKKCEAMAGLTKEGDSIISDTKAGTATRDVGIIMAAQKIEHYEIASYGGIIQLAKTLGYEDCAEILVKTLNEEKLADEALTDIAENSVNYQSSQEKQTGSK